MDRIALLKKVGIFSGLKKRALESLAEVSTERLFKKGEILVKEGQSGIGLYVIASGRVKIVKETPTGDTLELAVLGPGNFFGEMSVLDDAPRSASAIAVEDSVCLLLAAWEFKARMGAHPEIALAILPVVVKRFRDTSERMLALMCQ